LTFGALLQIAAADTPGLYLRAVVDEGAKGAILMADEDGQAVYVSPVAMITPDDAESAKLKGDEDVSISFKFTLSGQTKLGEATRSMIGKKLAIIVDGKLLSTPVVRSKFSKGADITGDFSREWADSVVESVKANRKG
jgi:preprotein translocase subunit SecD